LRVVLHSCCGVCMAGAATQLKDEGYEVTGYFFNPNIHPSDEYVKRLDAVKTVAAELGIPLVVAEYDPAQWLRETASLAGEKEGGRRCQLCYRIRLQKTVEYMNKINADAFTTTLTIGPKKAADIINKIGREIGNDRFLARDFKKREGYKKANALARQLGIYRQHYCGCVYSVTLSEQK
jgi:predicted adenine nucleotide alpha hydrolase (AANH) superfamily ATPase